MADEILISECRRRLPDAQRVLEQLPRLIDAIDDQRADLELSRRRQRLAKHALRQIETHDNGDPKVELRDVRMIARVAREAMEAMV